MVKFILTVQLCLIAISSFAQPKPIAFYPLNGNANDLSGNGFNGIVSGAIPTIDRCGKANSAYYFDGIDDVITIADNNILDIGTQDYTIVAWIKTNAEDWGRIVSKGSSSCQTGYMMRTGGFLGSIIRLENAYQPNCEVLLDGIAPINDNQWHCIAGVVKRSSFANIYVDGGLDNQQIISTSGIDLSNSRDLLIGANYEPWKYPEWFNGSIDDVKLFNIALSLKEVKDACNNYNIINEKISICAGKTYKGHSTSGIYNDTIACELINKLDLTVMPAIKSTKTKIICEKDAPFLGHFISGIFSDTLKSVKGCDSISTLKLTVLLDKITIENINICQGQSYKGYSTTGVYDDSFIASNGCDSIRTINLNVVPDFITFQDVTICEGNNFNGHILSGFYADTIHTAGFCDTIKNINLTVLTSYNVMQDLSICEGDYYKGHNISGIYIDTIRSFGVCDTILVVNLKVLPKLTIMQDITICDGDSYKGYTASGLYIDTLHTLGGCDTIRTLNLTISSNFSIVEDISICEGENYKGYLISGIYFDTISTFGACDSFIMIKLSVLPNLSNTINITICNGETYNGHSTTGIYIDTLSSKNGCDTIRTLNLIVLPNYKIVEDVAICQGEIFQGHSTSGLFSDTLQSKNGCDSILLVNLTVLTNSINIQNIKICQGEEFMGHSTNWIHIDTLKSMSGCDSLNGINLTVLPIASSFQNINICQGDNYGGHATSGIFVDTLKTINGCDSLKILNLAVNPIYNLNQKIIICNGTSFLFNGQLITSDGIYKETIVSSLNCDSTVTIDLKFTKNNFLGKDTSICTTNDYLIISPFANTIWYDNTVGRIKKIFKTGEYWAKVIDSNGCEIIDTVQIKFYNNIFVPNTFSPNKDGINDYFHPYFPVSNFKSYKFRIYSRWGSLVFSSTNPDDKGWNGQFKGLDCNPDVYVYTLEIETEFCAKSLIKGDVTLQK